MLSFYLHLFITFTAGVLLIVKANLQLIVTPVLEKPYTSVSINPERIQIVALFRCDLHSEIDNGGDRVFINKKVYSVPSFVIPSIKFLSQFSPHLQD